MQNAAVFILLSAVLNRNNESFASINVQTESSNERSEVCAFTVWYLSERSHQPFTTKTRKETLKQLAVVQNEHYKRY